MAAIPACSALPVPISSRPRTRPIAGQSERVHPANVCRWAHSPLPTGCTDFRPSVLGRIIALTCFCRPEHGSSTATSIKSFVAAIRGSESRQAQTLPPFCDGLLFAPSAPTPCRAARPPAPQSLSAVCRTKPRSDGGNLRFTQTTFGSILPINPASLAKSPSLVKVGSLDLSCSACFI